MRHLIKDDFDGMWGDETPQPKQKSTATTREFTVIYSAESRAKISAAHKGKTLSAETRARISAANKNRTPEQRAKTRAKISAAVVASYKNKTPEQRAEIHAKMAAAAKAVWEKRRHTPVMTPYGAYPSITAVAKAANRMNQTVRAWIKKYPKHYYYLPKDAS